MRLRNNLLGISCCFISCVPFLHLYLKMSLCVKEDDSQKFCLLGETKTVCASLVPCFPQAPSGCACLCCSWRITPWNPTVFGNLKAHNNKKIDSPPLIIGNARYVISTVIVSFLAFGLGVAEPCFVGCCPAWRGFGVFVVQGSPCSTVKSITDVLSMLTARCMSQIMDHAVNTGFFSGLFSTILLPNVLWVQIYCVS